MKLSRRGISFIDGFEGNRLEAYKDEAGIWTIGRGHIGAGDAFPGNKITEARSLSLFDMDNDKAEAVVNKLDGRRALHLTQTQFDALVSFEFNTGALSNPKNKVTQHVIACRDDLVDDEMLRWDKVTDAVTGKKKVSNGLKRRRLAEAELWMEGCIPEVVTPAVRASHIEATARPVAPTGPTVEAVTSPAVHGSAVASVSTVLATATEQIEPLAAYSDALRILFVVLALAGVGLAVWGATRGRRS
jgi:lysozyme